MARGRALLGLLAIFALVAAPALAEVEKDGDVWVLHDKDFDKYVKPEKIILVEFYAPWCGHCKSLAPEYAKAATMLKDDGIPLAKVDATVENDVSTKYEVRGYPTLKIFRNGVASDYNGPRDAAGIVSYMQIQGAPAARKLDTKADLERQLTKLHGGAHPEPLVVYFAAKAADVEEPKKAPALAKVFLEVAEGARETTSFAWTADPEAAAAFGAKAGQIALLQPTALKSKEEKMAVLFAEKKQDSATILSWIQANILPLVGEFSERTVARYQSAGKPTVRVAVPMDWAADAKGSNYHLNRIRRLAKAHAKDFAFAAISPSAHELSEFGVGGNDFSVTISDAAGRKFAFEGTWNPGKDDPKEVSAFLAAFLKGEVEPYVKSEPVPEGKANGVTVAVGKTFESVVLDDSKDVFIEFYAPWCGHCKTLAPKYEALAQKLAGVETLTIAKLDATANDWTHKDKYDVKGFPTLYFKPAGAAAPISYDGEREVDAMAQWLAGKATHMFEVPGGAEGKKGKKKSKKGSDEL